MSYRVDKKTGEVKPCVYSKFMKKSEPLDVGSMIIQQYDFAWDDKTRDFIVVEGAKEDRQAYIDSFKDDCGVVNVLKKYALTGDASLLNCKEGFYGDISDLPVDELNVSKLTEDATSSLDRLNQLLGTSYTAEEFAKLSQDELATLISGVAKPETSEKVEDKENA